MGFVIQRKQNYTSESKSNSNHVQFSMWSDGNKLHAQINSEKIHTVIVKQNNWDAANVFMCTQIPEIKQYIDEIKRRTF